MPKWIPMMDNLLDIPSCVAALSLVFLTINVVLSKSRRHEYTDTTKDSPKSPTRTALRTTRSVCLAALCVVQLLGNIWQAPVYFYATIISLKQSPTTSIHLEFILLSALGVYAYRDIYPLITYDLSPQNESESPTIWVKIILLLLTSVIIPLLTPGVYVPVDPQNPMPTLNPSQIASPLSTMFYLHLDPLVSRAYKQVHLPANELPPLADNDMAKHLKAKHFKHLNTNRHLFFWLFRVFRWDVLVMAAVIQIKALSAFASPLAMNQLLVYLQTADGHHTIRPWFWILLLLIAPVFDTVSVNWFMFLAQRTLVRAESLLTELLFEHALKIRIKAASGSEDNDKEMDDKATNMSGKLSTLVTVDLNNIAQSTDCMLLFAYFPTQAALCTIFLYKLLGWSAFVGIAITILTIPIPSMLVSWIHKVQVEQMKKTDARVQVLSDVMNVLKMIKLFGWEQRMSEKVLGKRNEELALVRKGKVIDIFYNVFSAAASVITVIATFACYVCSTLVAKSILTASVVFPSLIVFEAFKRYIQMAFFYVIQTVGAKVALDRVNDFLKGSELLDEFAAKKDSAEVTQSVAPQDKIGFNNALFTWTADVDSESTYTPGRRRFVLRIPEELVFKRGAVNLVMGPTGSGKTSLLLALLGEMHFIPPNPDSWFSLSRAGGVAYAAQEAWVLNETIKENILFGLPYDETRYKTVLYQCALERDLSIFSAGDLTEVGERGITLSGGQKARISLARAVYSNAEVLLLDDILAALDVHTAKWIVDECLSGDLLQSRTVILVTHNVALVKNLVRFVAMVKDGLVTGSEANLEELSLLGNSKSPSEASDVTVRDEEIAKDTVQSTENGKLILAEEIQIGHAGWSSVKLYSSALGGDHPILFFGSLLITLFLSSLGSVLQTWYLGYWATQYEDHAPEEVSSVFHLNIYALIFVLSSLMFGLYFVIFVYGGIRASVSLHSRLVGSIFGATLRWLETTPVSRILTRFTRDIRSIDTDFPKELSRFIELTATMVFRMGSILVIVPAFVFPCFIITALGVICGMIYLKAQVPVKREMSNAKTPVLGHINAAFADLASIRAYSAQSAFIEQSLTRIDQYSRTARVFYDLQRWVGVRTDLLAGVFAASVAWYLVYLKGENASNSGFSLNMAVGFTGYMFWWILRWNAVETESNSMERITHYLEIEQERKPTQAGIPPAYWPSSGELRVENLSAKYSSEGPTVLRGLTFHLKAGERIGVVGRTGSGKSTLALSLLRCIPTDGEVFYDNLPTSNLNLDALRSKITIIPQSPELISGNLRQNLDPFGEHDDHTLNGALASAGLQSSQRDLAPEGCINLDTTIASGGTNLSVGQRQIIALARAIVRQSKLLILDEATSAIDYETDSIIQSSLRNDLGRDVTVITIAHRLQTVMDVDKIIVLDAGDMVEFDTPKNLLQKTDGYFKALVDQSHDKQVLLSAMK